MQYGTMEVTNHKSLQKSVITFKACGWFGNDLHKIEGFLLDKEWVFVLVFFLFFLFHRSAFCSKVISVYIVLNLLVNDTGFAWLTSNWLCAVWNICACLIFKYKCKWHATWCIIIKICLFNILFIKVVIDAGLSFIENNKQLEISADENQQSLRKIVW